jgi:hypothetical protein
LELGEIDVKLVSFLENPLATSLNECVKLGGKLRHAIAQIFESEIDAGQRVGHGGGICRGEGRAHATRRKGGLK